MATRLDHDQSVVALYDPTVTGKASLSIQPDTFVDALTRTTQKGLLNPLGYLPYGMWGTSRLTETAKTLHCAKSCLEPADIVATYDETDQRSFTVNRFTHALDVSPAHQAGPHLASDIHEAILEKAYAEAKASLEAYKKDKSAANKDYASQKLLVLRTIHHCLESKLETIIDPKIQQHLTDSLILHSHENLLGDDAADLGRTFRIPPRRLPDFRPLGRDRAAAHEGTAPSDAEDEEAAIITEKQFIQLIYRDFLLKPKGTQMPKNLRDLARENSAFEQLLEQAIEAKARNSDGTLADNAKAALKCLTRGVHHTGRFVRNLFEGPHDPLAIAARSSALDRSSWTLPPKPVLDHKDVALEALVDLSGETFEDIAARKAAIEEYAERALGFIGKICFEQSLGANGATLDAKLAHAGTEAVKGAVDQLDKALDHLSEKVLPILHRLDELAYRYATPEKRSAFVQALTSLTPAELLERTSIKIQQAVDRKLGPAMAHVAGQLLPADIPTSSIDSAELLAAKFPRKADGDAYPSLERSNPHFARLRDASQRYVPRDLATLLDEGLAHTLQNAPNKKDLKLCILTLQRRLAAPEVNAALRAAPKEYGELITQLNQHLKDADGALEQYPRDPTERANHFYTIALALEEVHHDSIVHLFTPAPREGGAVSPLTHHLQVIRESQTGIEETSRLLARAMKDQTTATTQLQRDAATARIGVLNRQKTRLLGELTRSLRGLDDLIKALHDSMGQLSAAFDPDGTKAVWVDPAA